ncbi:MAG: DUF4298 domain-containing protein [Lachnospiraceae bacterium]|nr:DUF4298 domain-containing protein [Lachnospiraceae bacterium]
MNQTDRIRLMEEKMDRVRSAMEELSTAADLYKELQQDIKDLERYYETVWRDDFEDDEKGKLPQELKRGVLSENELYNLLSDIDAIKKSFQ